MGGRPRKATAIKIAQGTAQKCRILPNEMTPAKVRGLPVPPEAVRQTEGAELIWYGKVRELKRLGMITVLDMEELATYCIEMATYFACILIVNREGRYYGEEGQMKRTRPEVTDAREALDRAFKIGQRFGFNPSDRGRIAMPEPKEEDELGFLNE